MTDTAVRLAGVTGRRLEVLAAGPLATVQDLGRPGLAELGVSRSGAADRGALRLANRLVGNAESAAGVEITLGGLVVRLTGATTVAFTGARCPLSGHRGGWHAALSCPAGSVLALGTPPAGLRSYLAVRGGLAVPAVLGSRATDTLSGLGPAVLAAGQRLAIGTAAPGQPGEHPGQPGEHPGHPGTNPSQADRPSHPGSNPTHPGGHPEKGRPDHSASAGAVPVRVAAGPRPDWFVLDRLFEAAWQVRPDSNRIGTRLAGPALRPRPGFERAIAELPSEPTLPGAIQVPPDGQPIVLGPDAPVTGGYPVVAVLPAAELDLLAQLRPGSWLRLVSAPTGPRSAAAGRPR